jgi:hypothetical protein
MKNLSDFFQKFRSLNKKKEDSALEVIKIIQEISSINVSPTEIYLEDNFVKINVSPLKRGEVFMYKEKIIKEFEARNLNFKEIK